MRPLETVTIVGAVLLLVLGFVLSLGTLFVEIFNKNYKKNFNKRVESFLNKVQRRQSFSLEHESNCIPTPQEETDIDLNELNVSNGVRRPSEQVTVSRKYGYVNVSQMYRNHNRPYRHAFEEWLS